MNQQINHHPHNEYLNTNLRLKRRSMSSDSDKDGCSKRFRPSPESNSEDGEMTALLGLTLKKTPSLINLIEAQLLEGNKPSSLPRRLGRPPIASRNTCEKLKASSFSAINLKIGEWARVSRYEGDLVAKCYYAKRKLVWEILEGPRKSKIEVQWSDIIAIKAIIQPGDRPGVLELELNQPPSFYREINPQPRKHTLWQQTSDFTGGQASIYRRHCVRFLPGVLDKHYEKLLHYDARLNELSKETFPRHFESDTRDFSFDNDYGYQFFLNHPSSSVLFPNHPMHNKSTPIRHFSSSFPVSGGRRSNYQLIDQRRVLWGQGPNNLVNVAMENQTIGMFSGSTPQPQNHQSMYQQNDSMVNNQDNIVLNYIKNHLLNDNQVASSNESKLVANMDSINSLLDEHHKNGSLDVTSDVHGLNFGCQVMDNYSQGVVPNNGMTYAEPFTWMVPQGTIQDLKQKLTMEHSASPYPTWDVNQDVRSLQAQNQDVRPLQAQNQDLKPHNLSRDL